MAPAKPLAIAVCLAAAAAPGARPPVPIESLLLGYEFRTNKVAAEAKYKGHTILVSGLVKEVSIIRDEARVLMTGGVRCDVSKPWPKEVERLAPDQCVVVRGDVRGIPKSVTVVLQPCALIDKKCR